MGLVAAPPHQVPRGQIPFPLRPRRRARRGRRGGLAGFQYFPDYPRHPLARHSNLQGAAQESAITGMKMKLGDFAAQVFRPPHQANPPDKIAIRVEESRGEKPNDGCNQPGPRIERAPQHLRDITLRRQVMPLAKELAECPRRQGHFFACGKRYSKREKTRKNGRSDPLKRHSSIRLAAFISSRFRGITDVRRAIPNATLIEASPDFVGLTEVAELLHVSRQNVRKLIHNSDSLAPMPIHEGRPTIWHLAKVLQWLREQKGYPIEDDLNLAVSSLEVSGGGGCFHGSPWVARTGR